jgi:hypothetical protein
MGLGAYIFVRTYDIDCEVELVGGLLVAIVVGQFFSSYVMAVASDDMSARVGSGRHCSCN